MLRQIASIAPFLQDIAGLRHAQHYGISYKSGQALATAMAIDRGATLACMASKQTKRIPGKHREAFARALKKLMDEKYDGNQTAVGKALDITQGHISAMLAGNRGPGLNTLLLMRLETGQSIDAILGFAASPVDELSQRLVASVDMEVARIRAEQRELQRELEELRSKKGNDSDEVPETGKSVPARTDIHSLRKRKASSR